MAYSFYMMDGSRKVEFPIPPSELETNIKGRNETIDLLNEGEVNRLKSPGLTEISFTALIPQTTKYPFAVNSETVDTFVNFLNDMITEKKPFRFMVVRTAGNRLLYDTNMQVSCESYDLKESANNGFDVELTINLKQYRKYGTKTITLIKVDNTTKVSSKDDSRDSNKKGSGKYVVKKGDTLWGISRKLCGDGTLWGKLLYVPNKKVIEDAAKAHGRKSSSTGHWIYPGTELVYNLNSVKNSIKKNAKTSVGTSTASNSSKPNSTNNTVGSGGVTDVGERTADGYFMGAAGGHFSSVG